MPKAPWSSGSAATFPSQSMRDLFVRHLAESAGLSGAGFVRRIRRRACEPLELDSCFRQSTEGAERSHAGDETLLSECSTREAPLVLVESRKGRLRLASVEFGA